jgi:hypothetical protein
MTMPEMSAKHSSLGAMRMARRAIIIVVLALFFDGFVLFGLWKSTASVAPGTEGRWGMGEGPLLLVSWGISIFAGGYFAISALIHGVKLRLKSAILISLLAILLSCISFPLSVWGMRKIVEVRQLIYED